MKGDEPRLGEERLIKLIHQSLEELGQAVDLDDDCALIQGETRLLTTDALIEGVHFDLRRDSFEQIGAQAAVANLSDLAASGGRAAWLIWSLILAPNWGEQALLKMTRGFVQVGLRYGARLVGGNLSRSPGPGILAVSAGGPLAGAQPFLRSGAKPGDGIYLSGPLGDAALGVLEPDPEARAQRHRWRPHLPEAATLAAWGEVSAAMDISDGLLKDLSKLCKASGLGAALESQQIPIGPLCRHRHPEDLSLALEGGEDYLLLFTTPKHPPLGQLIGYCQEGEELLLDGLPVSGRGWDPFA